MVANRRPLYWVAGFGAFLALVFLLSDILLPFVAGIILAYLLDPIADFLERHRFPRWLAAGLITLLATTVVISVLLVLVPLLQSQIVDFAGRLPNYVELLREKAVALLAAVQTQVTPEEMASIREKIGGAAGPNALAWIGNLLTRIWGGGVALLNLLSLLVITPIVMFYLLRDWDDLLETIEGWLPRHLAPVIREKTLEIDGVLSGFLRGQFSVCLLLGLLYAIGLTAVGLDFGLIIGFVTGLISFVPYFGMLIGFAIGLGVAIAQFSDWQPIAMVAGVFVIGQFLEGNFITPRLVGERIGLHPAWIIFALLAGGALFGFTGILLAVPVAAVVGVLGRFAIQQYKQSAAYLGSPDVQESHDDGDGTHDGSRG
ncbi:MAG: AI-2E family transporter [Proteobacteria bacterium]|nr:AI-2E family transporter [Pseudomonadota bacterium]